MKKTMIEIANNFIRKNGASNFQEIWNCILDELKNKWKEEIPNLLMKDIEEKKKSELHTILTISGEFERLLDGKYQLAEKLTFAEIKVLREDSRPKSEIIEENS